MHKKKPKYKGLGISLLLSVLMTCAGVLWIDAMDAATLYDRLVFPLARLCVFIGIGLAMAQVLEVKGWTKKLGVVASPLFSFANLGHRCSATFSAAFFSGVSSNAMLVDFHREGKISKQQLFLTNFINQFPAYFLHLPTTFFVVVSITRTAGLLYFALTFAAVVLRTIIFVIYGRYFVRPAAQSEAETTATEGRTVSGSENSRKKNRPGKPTTVWHAIKTRLPGRYANILFYLVPIYVAISLLTVLGAFDLLRDVMADSLEVEFVPVEALSVVILSFVAEFTSGFAAAGALLDQGVITVKETVLALIAGNILAFPVRALRHQLPRYMGIFSPGMGLQLLLMGQFFRIFSLVVVAVIFYVVV